jgi:hypothetical protein
VTQPAYPHSLLANSLLNSRANEPVRTATIQQMQQTYGNRAVRRYLQRTKSADSLSVDNNLPERIQSTAGSGSRLDTNTQQQLEAGLGADVSGVRVPTDGEGVSAFGSTLAVQRQPPSKPDSSGAAPSHVKWNKGNDGGGTITKIDDKSGKTIWTVKRIEINGLDPPVVVYISPQADKDLKASKDANAKVAVALLLHFHGNTGGDPRHGGTGGEPGDPNAQFDNMAAQLGNSGSKVIAVLPQANPVKVPVKDKDDKPVMKDDKPVTKTRWTDFGNADKNIGGYLNDVFSKLKAAEGWVGMPDYSGNVVVTGHSAGGPHVGKTLTKGSLQPTKVIIFDAINGPNELEGMITWVWGELDKLLATLATAKNHDDEVKALSAAPLFWAYYHGPEIAPDKLGIKGTATTASGFAKGAPINNYSNLHGRLKLAIEHWPTSKAGEINKLDPSARAALTDFLTNNVQVIRIAGVEHEELVGKSKGIEKGLTKVKVQP